MTMAKRSRDARRVLILEDEEEYLNKIYFHLREAGLDCVATRDGEDAVKRVQDDRRIVAATIDEVLHVQSPDTWSPPVHPEKQRLQGKDVIKRLRQIRPEMAIALVSSALTRRDDQGQPMIPQDLYTEFLGVGVNEFYFKSWLDTDPNAWSKLVRYLKGKTTHTPRKPLCVSVCYGYESAELGSDSNRVLTLQQLIGDLPFDPAFEFEDIVNRVEALVRKPRRMPIRVFYNTKGEPEKSDVPTPGTQRHMLLELVAAKSAGGCPRMVSEREYQSLEESITCAWWRVYERLAERSGVDFDRAMPEPIRVAGWSASSAGSLKQQINNLRRNLDLPTEAIRSVGKSAEGGLTYEFTFPVEPLFVPLLTRR